MLLKEEIVFCNRVKIVFCFMKFSRMGRIFNINNSNIGIIVLCVEICMY